MNKVISSSFARYEKVLFAAVLITGSIFVAGSVSAACTVENVTLGGSSVITAVAGSPLVAKVDVSLTNQSAWKSTQYTFGNGKMVCVDTPNHKGNGIVAEKFQITTPSKLGTNKVSFKAYENNDCTNGQGIKSLLGLSSMTGLPASLLTAAISIFSFGTGGAWLSIVSLILVIIIVAFVVSYIIKRIVDKKEKITGNK